MVDISVFIAGICIASIAMAIGIGGGILWTPLLILVYGINPQESVTNSLLIQVAGLASGTYAYSRNGLVKMRMSLKLFMLALPGIIIGSFVTIQMEEKSIKMALGFMAMTLAVLFVSTRADTLTAHSQDDRNEKLGNIAVIPAFFGFIMGLLSVGIGEWLIPALRAKLKIPMLQAIGTSITMMLMLAIVAAVIHILLGGTLDYRLIVSGSLGTIIGAQIGAAISRKINDRILKQSFIYLMMLTGIHLIFQSI